MRLHDVPDGPAAEHGVRPEERDAGGAAGGALRVAPDDPGPALVDRAQPVPEGGPLQGVQVPVEVRLRLLSLPVQSAQGRHAAADGRGELGKLKRQRIV